MESVVILVGFVVALLIGFVFAKFIFRSTRHIDSKKISELEKANAVLSEKNKNQQSEYERILSLVQIEKDKFEENLKEERLLLNKANQEREGLRTLLKSREEQNQELRSVQEKFTKDFELIANKIFEEKTQKFTEQNKLGLESILSPLHQRIKDFEEKVDKSYKSEAEGRNSLKGEITQLMNLNKRISEEANNLAKALKGDNKQQGNWGEFVLERVLEASGLTEGESYTVQGKGMQLMDENGNRLQPDVIIHLPDNKHIVIDSKVSLAAYDKLVNADEDKEFLIKQHILSIRNHIKGLSEKNYQKIYQINSPDFVLLFIPIESSFSIALQHDRDLFDFAWNKRIVPVTPSTLLATLKTVASIWKQEQQTQNALEIANKAAALYEKFVSFINDLEKLGSQIDKSKETYNDAFTKLTGKGSLINRVAALEKLGVRVKPDKRIDSKFIDEEDQSTE